MSIQKIAEEHGTTRHYITKWLKEKDIKIRFNNSDLRRDFFKIIDTEEKAYWLGYVWCDGNINVRKVKNGLDKCFSLDICERDHKHLYKFKEAIQAENKVEKLKAVERSLTSDKWRYRIRVKMSDFVDVLLEQYKMIPYRTNIDRIKEHMPRYLIRHFIRGVLDADGSVMLVPSSNSTTFHQSAHISLSLTYDMADYIADYFHSEGFTRNKPTIGTVYEGVGSLDIYSIRIGGNIQTPRILDHLYADTKVYMDRKYDKYIEIKNYIKERGGDK